MNYKVSVIVPVYNGASFIKQIFSNLMNQTLKELEIIFVDDGSTDDSAEILEECAQGNHRVTVIHQNNQGVSAARNSGIERASGEYIGFVDMDDSVDEDMFEYLYRIAKQHDLDFISMDPIGMSGSVTVLKDRIQALSLFCDFTLGMSACYKLFRRALYPSFSFPEGKRINEDAMAVYRAIQSSSKIACVNVCKYHYNVHEGSSSKQKCFSEKYFDAIDLADEMCREIEIQYPQLKEKAEKRKVGTYLRISKIYWMREAPKDCYERIVAIRTYLKQIPLNKVPNLFSRFDLIRYGLYRWSLPLFRILIHTIDRK